MVLLLSIVSVLCALILFTPLILSRFVPRLLMKRWPALQLHIDGPGFLFPFYFRASTIHFEWDAPGTDRLMFRTGPLHFRLSYSFLLSIFSPGGLRFRLRHMRIDGLVLEYENRMDSFQKTALLPRRGRLLIEGLHLSGGDVSLIDHTLPGPYRFSLRNIHIEDGHLDAATSIQLLFDMRKGRARLGDGTVEVEQTAHEGTLILRNVNWNAVIGLGSGFHLPGTAFTLHIRHRAMHGDRIAIHGNLHLLGMNVSHADDGGIPFAFVMDLNDYRLTLDLAVQRFVEQMLRHARPGLLESGVLLVGREIFERLKKIPGADAE